MTALLTPPGAGYCQGGTQNNNTSWSVQSWSVSPAAIVAVQGATSSLSRCVGYLRLVDVVVELKRRALLC
jgi:hypothetical protein